MTLKELQIGKSAIVDAVGGAGALRQHFLDMGLIPGAEVTLVKLAPMGDPMELRIHGYELTLRLDDAAQITVTPTEKTPAVHAPVDGKMVEHPGLGEGGKYHTKEGEHPLPEDKTLTFALAGNQNCGKTTLFNQLTGSNQHVGNFPGVTVDRKSGAIKGHPETEVTDLPGIYSMSPYSSEEIVTRQFIIGEKPTGIINIVDATNIERNLYLTMQLMELDIPMVLALNMMDEMRGNGGTVRINKMEAMLGIPVIPISAAKNEGVDELVDHAVHVAKYQERPGRMDFCSEDDHGGAVHRCIHGILHLIEDHAKAAGIPVRFAATKLVEGDPRIEEALKLDPNEKEMIEHIIVQMEQERGLDRAAAIADMRFSFIQKLVAQTVVKPHESKEQLRSNRIDKFLTGKYTAIPAFIAIMGLVFFLTFNVIGLFFQNLMEMGIDALTGVVDTALTSWNVNAAVHSLVIDGIFTGVGSVLSFLPIIVVLFFFLSMLEDTGYMARVAFVMDKLLRRIGLSGRSIVPMLIGFGCTVPGVMASRTLPSERDRKMTILLTPFMSCSAKLPIYSLFAAAFFPQYAGLVMVLLYFTGILVGVLAALLLKSTVFKGEAVPFVMELPNYRLPGLKNVAQLLWEKARDFLQKA
ncbi:MAG: ferrous iron transport protein B, partial [Faecalibacterium sp.]|nr:ferrous iron transport protein B [Faecalibacterium sp.]